MVVVAGTHKRQRLAAAQYEQSVRGSGSSGSSSTSFTAEQVHAGAEARKLLKEIYILRKPMTAKDLAILCYWLGNNGGCGVGDLGMAPERKNESNFSAHVKLILGREFEDPDLYYAEVPQNNKKGVVRQHMSISFRAPTDTIPAFLGTWVC